MQCLLPYISTTTKKSQKMWTFLAPEIIRTSSNYENKYSHVELLISWTSCGEAYIKNGHYLEECDKLHLRKDSYINGNIRS